MRSRIRQTLYAMLLAAASPAADAAIYRCPGEQGEPTFSQFPCGPGGPAERAAALEPLAIVRIPPLAASERRRLDAVTQVVDAQRRARMQSAARQRARAQRRREARARDCTAARERLGSLERRRRGGYPLRQARTLDRQQAELKRAIRLAC